MYLKRKVDTYLNEWHRNKDRKPLIIKVDSFLVDHTLSFYYIESFFSTIPCPLLV